MAATAAGYDGKRELVAREVPDPYDGKHLTVIVNTRESTLGHMLARGLIDEGQKAAGDRFRAIYERAIIGAAKAFDYRRPKVDGGKLFDPMHSSSAEAARALKWVRGLVGEADYSLLVLIAGDGRTIRDVVGDSRAARLYAGHRFRDALAILAVKWGFDGSPAGGGRR
jgi:hypothetical protein